MADPVEPFGISLNMLVSAMNECRAQPIHRPKRDNRRRCLEYVWTLDTPIMCMRLKRYRNTDQSRCYVLSGRRWLFQFQTHVAARDYGPTIILYVPDGSHLGNDSPTMVSNSLRFRGDKYAMLKDMLYVKMAGSFPEPLEKRFA